MKHINIILSCILVLGLAASCGSKGKKVEKEAANTEQAAAQADNWMVLFDGTSTAGWRSYEKPTFPPLGWEVVDGTLHCIASGNGEAGGPGGDLIYDKKFSNFELSFEWKIGQGGNSGVFILAQELPNEPIWKSGIEMQILDNDKHPDAQLGVNGNRKAGSLYDLLPANPQNTKPAGEWNQAGILCYQGTVVFKQNGANVVEFHLWTEDWKKMVENSKFKEFPAFVDPAHEGYIGLQDHGSDVWFRNIRIKEM
jgi:alpha-3'-ketoglucosidase